MSNKEKLIQFIENLTVEEAEKIIAFLETVPSSLADFQPPPQCSSPQEQEVVS